MKKFILILIIILESNLFCQWQNLGNYKKIKAHQTEIVDYVISQDNFYIYTLDSKDTLKKWDFNTGELLSNRKIATEITYHRANKNLFLSKDALTYIVCCNADYPYKIYLIFDINSKVCIDSLTINTSVYPNYAGYPDHILTDYFSNTKQFLNSCSFETHGLDAPYSGGNSGQTTFLVKTDTGWTEMKKIVGGTSKIELNNSKSVLFLDPEVISWSRSHGGSSGGGSTSNQKNLILNLNNLNIDTLSSYYKSQTDNDTTESGSKFNFYSAFFTNDVKKIYLSAINSLYFSYIDSVKLEFINTFHKYSDKTINILCSSDNNYFFIYLNNILDIYDFENYLFYRSIVFDSINIIKQVKYSNGNSYLFTVDTSGNLFRIDNNYNFSLYANFFTPDTITSQDFSVKFINCSLGYPDTYFWDFGDGQTATEKNPSHIFSDTGYYNIKLIITKNSDRDSIIKNKHIYVLPKLKANFDYTTSGTEPVNIQFNDQSLGKIDSVLWDFGDSSFSKETNPSHTYKISGIYNVSLKIYSKTLISKKTKEIEIEIIESKLDTHKCIYEYTDLNYYNAIAIKGYDDYDGYLVYHISQDSTFYHGAYYKFDKKWQGSILSGKDFLVKRQNWTYAYFNDSTVVNLDKFGNKSVENNIINSNFIESIKCFGNYITITHIKSFLKGYSSTYQSVLIDEDNLIKLSTEVRFYHGNEFGNYYYKLYKIISYILNNKIDYAASYDYSGINMGGYWEFNNNFIVNSYTYKPSFIINDFFRLDAYTLVFISDNCLKIIENESPILDSSGFHSSQGTILISKEFKSNTLKSLIKLNDTSFCVTGSCNGSPAYYIINKTGDIIDSCVLSNRYGCFEYVSLTWDSNLLFTGYRNKYYDYKSPYFVKFKNPLNSVQIDDTSKKISLNIYVYPNPVSDHVNFKFLHERTGYVSLNIYDSFGNCIYSKIENKNNGLCELNIDISSFSIGVYFYKLDYDGIVHSGKIIY